MNNGGSLEHFGIKGMKWGVQKLQANPQSMLGSTPAQNSNDKRIMMQSLNELSKDPSPKNIDVPAHSSHNYLGDGFTSNGTDYTKYSSGKTFYYKFQTGEKLFTALDLDNETWWALDSNNSLVPESELEAYKSTKSAVQKTTKNNSIKHFLNLNKDVTLKEVKHGTS